jgi:hyperosmotically inducible protein
MQSNNYLYVRGNTARFLATVAVFGACSAFLTGCDKVQSPAPTTTIGEKLDAAIDKTKAVAADVNVEAKIAVHDAQKRYDQDGPKVEARARDAAASAGKVIDDAAITAQISAGLARDPELSAIKIDVDTKDGAVILRGPAPSEAARERAASVARGVSGVMSVSNQLVLQAG